VNVKIRPRISWAGLIHANNLAGNDEVERQPCYWLQQTMSICADGQAAMCAVDIHGRVNAGNVGESSVEEVWREGLGPYRKMHQEKRFDELPEMCAKCTDWQSGYAEFDEVSGTQTV
jgi:radical SAM protein with 4Fe4S-binding SPASM domain